MHYYQHHINDFLSDTANLTDHQIATYMRMVWGYYKDEKPYPDDCESIAFAYRSDEKTVKLLLRHYFTLTDGEWHHSRCDKEISKYHAKGETARQSANARWRNANAFRPDSARNAVATDSDANQEPRTKNQEEAKEKKPSAPTARQLLEGVSDDVAEDFIRIRKAKRAPITKTAVDRIKREAHQAGITLDQALAVACERGWMSFKAEWYGNSGGLSAPTSGASQNRRKEL